MPMINRLPDPYGLLLDREQTITFSFEGKSYQGFAGDCIASALAANNQWLLSRSFKYHRPRALLTMAGQDANSLVQLPSDPNVLADREAIQSGLTVNGQNYSGDLEKDRAAWIGSFSKFLPVGFYYKAFFKPKGAWEKWAPMIREKAGLGVIDESFVPQYYDKQYRFVDVAIIGAGPAGMAAALAAAKTGAQVLLVDENPLLGGSLNYARFETDTAASNRLREQMINEIDQQDNIVVMTDAVCNGWFADNWLAIVKDHRLYKTRAKETILCVGSLEQQAVFHNNDLPGVMMSSAAQRLIHLYGVRPGQRAVVLTGNNHGYAVALDLLDAGVEVAAIVDMRSQPQYDQTALHTISRVKKALTGCTVYQANPSRNKLHLSGVDVRQIISNGVCADDGEVIDCDLLCMSVGYTPTYQLICQAGGQLSYSDNSSMFKLHNLPQSLQIAGSVNSTWDLDCVLQEARRAAVIATNALGTTDQPVPAPVDDNTAGTINVDWPIFAHPKGKEFVDYDEDLQIADIVNATRDGYEHVQLVKRYSTCGMGPSQGRHSALATARLVAAATRKTVAQTGVTTARPPFAPERLGHIAGRSFFPKRRTNIHYRHLEAGAQMMQAGAWYRPAYYGPCGSQTASVNAEIDNVRNNVGIIDVSTLGGIEVRGKDAGEFLNRFYTFGFVKQPVGRARYALLTNESGVVIDDGVACRLHEDHYYVTATTGGVDGVYQQMLKWQAQWRLNVDISNVTSAYCGVNIAGPKARTVLQTLCDDVDLSSDAFPYMGVREGSVAGIPARLIRVGFVGELGYEVHAPQHCGEALWDALIAAGKEHQLKPFGVEAQRVLRLEKGHIIIGQDTDAMSNPMEVQMAWAVSRKKPFFVGGRTLTELNKTPLSRVLAGFVIDDPKAPIPLESHLVLGERKQHSDGVDRKQMIGRVTSCQYSPTLAKPIGLAYVPPDSAKTDSRIVIKLTDGKTVNARVVSLPFYDPENQRQEH